MQGCFREYLEKMPIYNKQGLEVELLHGSTARCTTEETKNSDLYTCINTRTEDGWLQFGITKKEITGIRARK